MEDLPKRCLTQVPSMRVANPLPISWASWGVILWPRKVATCSALTVRKACRESCSIERFEDGLRAEHQIGGVFDLHEAPVVGRSEEVEYRTALRGIAVEDLMQSDGREVVGQCLRPLPVVDAQKGVVGQLEADAGGGELASQPAMSVAIELETERTPGGNAQIDQAQVGVDEVEVIMQAFTGRRAQERAMGLLAMPGLVSGAGFHRRDDMHQAGMVAAR